MRVYAISRDLPSESRDLATKIAADGRGAPRISFLSDPHSAVIDLYGLRDRDYAGDKLDGVPRPAVFVLDKGGRVRWSRIESDYRQRPSTEEVGTAIDSFE